MMFEDSLARTDMRCFASSGVVLELWLNTIPQDCASEFNTKPSHHIALSPFLHVCGVDRALVVIHVAHNQPWQLLYCEHVVQHSG